MPSVQARKRITTLTDATGESNTKDIFTSAILGAPVELRYKIGWPLDLFMTPSSIAAYSEIHAYLFALQDTHTRVSDAWTRLSLTYRQRQKLGDSGRDDSRRKLTKRAWSTSRTMLFFLDQLLGHFTIDVVDVQHRRLIDDLDIVRLNEDKENLRSRSGSMVSPAVSMRDIPAGAIRQKQSISRLNSISKSYAGSMRGGAVSPTSEAYDGGSVRSRVAPPTPRRTQATFLDFLSLR